MTASDTVILLHGLGRMASSMRPMERALRRAGYRTRNVDYPSTCHPADRLAEEIVGAEVDAATQDGAERIHFVTHSMGGILARAYTAAHPLPAGSRAVMLAPPHGGSELADVFRDVWPFRRFCGPAFDQMGVGPESLPQSLGPPGIETGVIAGDRNLFPFLGPHFEGPTDGIVAVWSTRATDVDDHIVVPSGHTYIMRSRTVIRQTLHFLKHGAFARTS